MNSAAFAKNSKASAGTQNAWSRSASSTLRIGEPNDAYEREADRVAEAVIGGRRAPAWSISKVKLGAAQRQTLGDQPAPKPNNYDEAAKKLGEAFLKTDVGKKLTDAAKQDPLVKGAEGFIDTLPGKIIAGAAAVGAVSALAATHTALPAQIPEIPLDSVRPGLSVKITYEGPVDHPTKAAITFSYSPKGEEKKPKQTASERYRAETARIAAEQEKFRAGMRYKPGSPQDLEQKQEQKMMDDYMRRRFGTLPGFGDKSLVPAAPSGQGQGFGPQSQMPTFENPFQPKTHSLLDQKLELKRISSTPKPDEKKEEVPVQRKAEPGAATLESPMRMNAVLESSGRPLDAETRATMESQIGFDFAKVRIHTGPQAAESARAMGARAYTIGTSVVFAASQFSPATAEGRKLIAHELTHTVQQGFAPPVTRRSAKAGPIIAKSAGTQNKSPRLSGGEAEPPSRLVPLDEGAAGLQREREVRQAGILAQGPRFRVPTTADLKALFTSGGVPEKVLKDSVELALNRMAEENRLKSKEPVDDIMKKIFPSAGGFDEAAYEAAVDITDRTQIYKSVLDAEAKVAAGDKPKLKTTMQDAMKLIDDSIADEPDIKLVFGTKHAFAKTIYGKAKDAIQKAVDHMDERITTDYNLDDPETGVGGWAMFVDPHTHKPHVHFESSVVKVKDEVEAKITIIHESCHLADPSVTDEGKYYRSPGFEAETDSVKATNAAHYEEVPMRILKLSRYKGADGHFIEFKPGMSTGGTPQTLPEKARTKADQILRKAWDKAADVFSFIREVRAAEMAGHHSLFNARKARLMEISKLMHLTIHQQPAATATVNQVDVVLAEGVAHAMIRIEKNAPNQTLPFELKMPRLKVGFQPQPAPVMTQKLQLTPIPGLGPTPAQEPSEAVLTQDQAAARIVEGCIKDYGQLLGNYDDDKKLVDWLVKEYGKPL